MTRARMITPGWYAPEPRFPSAVPTREQITAWAPSEAAIFPAVQAQADERDRGLEMLGRGRRRRQPEPRPCE